MASININVQGNKFLLHLFCSYDFKFAINQHEKGSKLTCLVCGEPIGQNHSNYYGNFCGYCGPKLSMVRAASKAYPNGFTLSELWEDLATRGDRSPLKEHLPGMLQYLGHTEDGSIWKPPKDAGSLEQLKANA